MDNTSITTAHSVDAPAAGGPRQKGIGDVLVFGFATALTTWVIGYLTHMPGMVTRADDGTTSAVVPAPVVFVLLVLVLLGGGWLAARKSARGKWAGLGTGLVASLLNLIILSSLAGGKSPTEPIAPSAVPWLAVFVVAGAIVGLIGGVIGEATRKQTPGPANWLQRFVRVTGVTVLLMLGAGGVVTAARAGLAVPDWPNSEGYFMVFYPLSHMTGGKFYEHAHRLYGVLLGLTTLVLGLWIIARDRRRWMKALGLVAILMVIGQGILGGLRVTGEFTPSMDRAELSPNLALGAVHGVTAHLFLSLIAALAAFTSNRWTGGGRPFARATNDAGEPQPIVEIPPFQQVEVEGAGTDRTLAPWLLVVVFLQIVSGALLRHFGILRHSGYLYVHIIIGVAVAAFALFLSVRYGAIYKEKQPFLAKLGRGLQHLVWTQIILGFVAWGFGGGAGTPDMAIDVAMPPPTRLAFTTIHQLVGALVLAWTTLIVAWTPRLVREVPATGTPATADADAASGGD